MRLVTLGPSGVHSALPPWARRTMLALPVHVGPISRVAQATTSIAVFRSPADAAAWQTLQRPPSGAPLVFLIQDERDGWLRVLLPVRPNQSQGWTRAADVQIYQHDYRMVISVGGHTLTVYRGSAVIMRERVGLGTATTPTPGGVYFTEELLRPTDPKGAYGPYAYGLSGFSPVLNEFMGGDSRIGIHGTNDPAGLGKSDSHGCIRLSNAAIQRLAGLLPLGVPVQITA